MNERIINVFYNEQCLPFKDKERLVHFPIVGNAFMNASNTTEIRFYADKIGGDARQWIVIGKLPNNKRGFKILPTSTYDSETNEYYYSFHLSQFFTQVKGDLYLCLGGANGGNAELDEDEVYEVLGNQVYESTGAIKLNIAYSTPILEGDTDIDNWQDYLSALGTKLDKNKGIVAIENTSAIVSGYEEGQMFYSKADQMVYKLVSGVLVPQGIGIVKTNSIGVGIVLDKSKIALDMCYVVFNSTNIIFKKANTDNNSIATFYSDLEFFDGNNSGNDTLGRSYFKVNVSTGAITESNIYEKNIYNKEQIDNQFYNKNQADGRFVHIDGTENILGKKAFTVYLPQSSLTPTDDKDLATKKYVDDLHEEITDLIPTDATTSNKLITKNEVEQKISTAEATFRGTYNSYAALEAYSGPKDNNDYAWVVTTDANGNTIYNRYIYVESTETWTFEWAISNIAFSSAQWNAINSGATSTLITYLEEIRAGTQAVPKATSATNDENGARITETYVKSVDNVPPDSNGNVDVSGTLVVGEYDQNAGTIEFKTTNLPSSYDSDEGTITFE